MAAADTAQAAWPVEKTAGQQIAHAIWRYEGGIGDGPYSAAASLRLSALAKAIDDALKAYR